MSLQCHCWNKVSFIQNKSIWKRGTFSCFCKNETSALSQFAEHWIDNFVKITAWNRIGSHFVLLRTDRLLHLRWWGGGGVGGLEGGYNFWKGLILGDQFWKCTKCDGGRNFKTQDWHYMLWLLKHIVIETKTKNTFSFISKPKSRLTTLCRLKILPAQNSCVHCIYDQRSRPRLCHWMKNIDRRLLPNISIHIHASDVLALLSDVELYNSSASLALTYAD